MPPLPKKKISKTRKRRRRMHLSTSTSNVTKCQSCQSPKLPHHACPTCGTYRGRKVLSTDTNKTES